MPDKIPDWAEGWNPMSMAVGICIVLGFLAFLWKQVGRDIPVLNKIHPGAAEKSAVAKGLARVEAVIGTPREKGDTLFGRIEGRGGVLEMMERGNAAHDRIGPREELLKAIHEETGASLDLLKLIFDRIDRMGRG
ncbi:MAG: hypothetical protein VW405_20085 [Rhodospirillaceae bacterium]